MAKLLLVAETNCADAAREAEFNEWYDKVHLPDIFKTPGFISIIRYESIEPSEGKAKFLSLYEIETDDIDGMMKTHADNMARAKAEGRYSELCVLVSRSVYRKIGSFPK